MVRKLYKHEMLYYVRSLLPVYIVLAGVAAVGRFIGFFESETTAYSIMRGSSIFVFILAILATLGLGFVFVIVRFYKNIFSGEGYLTLTLPVTPGCHLLVKVTSAVVANVASVIVSLFAICLFMAGDKLNELVMEIVYIIEQAAGALEGQLLFYVLEMIPIMLMALTNSILLFYMCISLGQLFRKNRILAAVGVYFGLYVFKQILSTILTVVFAVFADTWFENMFSNFHTLDYLSAVHMVLGVEFVWSILVALVYFSISKFVLTKKLNLE